MKDWKIRREIEIARTTRPYHEGESSQQLDPVLPIHSTLEMISNAISQWASMTMGVPVKCSSLRQELDPASGDIWIQLQLSSHTLCSMAQISIRYAPSLRAQDLSHQVLLETVIFPSLRVLLTTLSAFFAVDSLTQMGTQNILKLHLEACAPSAEGSSSMEKDAKAASDAAIADAAKKRISLFWKEGACPSGVAVQPEVKELLIW